MKPKRGEMTGAQKTNNIKGQGPNWILIAGGALLSTLSVRLGYRIKQMLDSRQPANTRTGSKENGKLANRMRSGNCCSHSNAYRSSQDEGCFCMSGTEGEADMKPQHNGQFHTEPDTQLPLVTVSAPVYGKENGVMWASSPDRLELPQKPFHHSNSSNSPSVSESGSDIFSKREVIQKLRQQLKRRDDMILEMQDQIADLQNSLTSQLSHSAHLQSLLDAANSDLFDSEREIQRLRKAIADHCVGQVGTEKKSTVPIWPTEGRNGHANGYPELEGSLDLIHDEIRESMEKGRRREGDRMEMLRREVGELKEVIEVKDLLLQNYKEQKSELSFKINELQNRLDSQLPNIL